MTTTAPTAAARADIDAPASHAPPNPGRLPFALPIALLWATGNHRHTLAPRLIAGVPLAGIGLMHVSGAAPMLPILRGTPLPLPELMATAAPIMQVVAGLMLLAGAWTRVGAMLAIGAMLGAIVTHLTFTAYPATSTYAAFDWPDEPPILLAIVVLAAAAYLFIRGAGRFSVDASITNRDANQSRVS